jgi:hypothetical protein
MCKEKNIEIIEVNIAHLANSSNSDLYVMPSDPKG